MSISIHQLSVGKPAAIKDYNGKWFTSSMRRESYQGTVLLTRLGITGDRVAAKFHGGPNRALHLFCLPHYRFFNDKAGHELPVPTFGENLTIVGADERDTYIGDRFKLGTAVIEVSQPTERCKNIGRSAGYRDMLNWIHEHMYTGWYVRVIEEGKFCETDQLIKIAEGDPRLNLDKLNWALFKEIDASLLQYALDHPTPAIEYKERIVKIASKQGVALTAPAI